MSVQPASDYIDIRTPEGKLICRYSPSKTVLEWKHKGVLHYFDLAEIAMSYERTKQGVQTGDSNQAVPQRASVSERRQPLGETGICGAQRDERAAADGLSAPDTDGAVGWVAE